MNELGMCLRQKPVNCHMEATQVKLKKAYRQNRYSDYRNSQRQRLTTYKYASAKRNIEWHISDEVAFALFNMACLYCGEEPTVKQLMGIDREDTAIGYQDGNIVPCCKICNKMKHRYSKEVFVAQCRKIARHADK